MTNTNCIGKSLDASSKIALVLHTSPTATENQWLSDALMLQIAVSVNAPLFKHAEDDHAAQAWFHIYWPVYWTIKFFCRSSPKEIVVALDAIKHTNRTRHHRILNMRYTMCIAAEQTVIFNIKCMQTFCRSPDNNVKTSSLNLKSSGSA